MAKLGSFGAALREFDPGDGEPDTFDFCGEEFTVVGEIPGMLELRIAAALLGQLGGLEGDAALHEALRLALTVPERLVDGKAVRADRTEWERFNALAIKARPENEIFTAITLNIMAAQAGRPTERRPTSSAGPSPTSTSSSSSASDSPGSQGLRPVDEVLGG